MTLIKPLYDFLAILYYAEPAKTNKIVIERSVKKTFKRIVGLGTTTPDVLIKELSGYSIEERARKLWQDANEKWTARIEHNQQSLHPIIATTKDSLKYIPGEMVT